MRKIIDYQDPSSAQALSDFLEIKGIRNQVRQGTAGHGVWVREDSQLNDAKALSSDFSPEDFKDGPAAKSIREQRARDQRPVFTRTLPTRTRSKTPWGLGIVFLMGFCIIVALVSKLGSVRMYPLMIVRVDPITFLYQRTIDWSEAWRMVTPIFIHFGLFHLGFNLMWLRRFGSQVEEVHGTIRMLALVAASAALGNVAQLYMGGPNFGGMSGVNYGLFGFVWMQSRYVPQGPYSVISNETWLLMVWLVLCATGLMGPVANAAHAMGLVVGLLAGLPAYIRFRRFYKSTPDLTPGNFTDRNLKGWKRFDRLYVQPYMPGWFLLVAVIVLLIG